MVYKIFSSEINPFKLKNSLNYNILILIEIEKNKSLFVTIEGLYIKLRGTKNKVALNRFLIILF